MLKPANESKSINWTFSFNEMRKREEYSDCVTYDSLWCWMYATDYSLKIEFSASEAFLYVRLSME